MVLINMYGRLEPILLSKKLGVGIRNLDEDWSRGIVDDLKEEMLIRAHNIKVWKESGIKDMGVTQYQPSEIVKKANWVDSEELDYSDPLYIIAKNLIQLEVLDFHGSFLKLKNDVMDSPTCEVQYPMKFMGFCHVLLDSKQAKSICKSNIPFVTYDSDKYNSKPLILNFVSSMVKSPIDLKSYNEEVIEALLVVGKLIDDFLEDEKDFWILDYIINALHDAGEYNAYYIFKIMSLIEMIIINPNNNGKSQGELERKLPKFLVSDLGEIEDKELFCTLVRKLRNKIAHGDFEAFQKLLEEYRSNFMKNFWYDEFEYSIESWTINSICLRLKGALSEILFEFFTKKQELLLYQKS